jgi:competence protein ComEC
MLTIPKVLFTLLSSLAIIGLSLIKIWPDMNVHVVFCNVGQGDAILISYQFTQLLIDSGPDSKVLKCLQKNIPFLDKTLEIVIATHPDKDHIGGFPAVFGQYKVNDFFLLGVAKNTNDFKAFRNEVIKLQHQGTKLWFPNHQVLKIGNTMELEIITPRENIGNNNLFSANLTETQLSAYFEDHAAKYQSINDVSIATLLKVGKYKHLLMADVETPGELALTRSKVLTKVDVLKAGHHGSKTSTTQALLDQIQPEYVVISSGKNNRYGHPHPEVVNRIEALSSKILRTDELGQIEWISDGSHFQWKTEHGL